MERVKVSYIVASYNHEKFVGAQLDSIRNQTFADLEIIVIDDGSSDGTVRVAQEIARNEPRLHVVAQENRGVVAARSRGIDLALGEYISIVDSDDLLPLDRTALMVEALDKNPRASMVYGDCWIIDENDRRMMTFFDLYPPVEGDFSTELFSNYCFTPAISIMFRRSAFDASGPLWGPGHSTDYLKWIELGLFGEGLLLRGHKLGCWRWHGQNVTMSPIEVRVNHYHELRNALEELLNKRPELRERVRERRIKHRLGFCHFMPGFYAGLKKQWPLARREFAAACRFDPSPRNIGAWISTMPIIRTIAHPLYKIMARKKLKMK